MQPHSIWLFAALRGKCDGTENTLRCSKAAMATCPAGGRGRGRNLATYADDRADEIVDPHVPATVKA